MRSSATIAAHVLYEMNKVRRRLERRAYAAIEREGEALGRSWAEIRVARQGAQAQSQTRTVERA